MFVNKREYRSFIVAKLFLFGLTATIGACQSLGDGESGTLVPPTVADDPSLPQLSVQVAGKSRQVHLQTFGDPNHPVMLVLHGSLSDYRALLPYQAFSDRYFVVMWDQRGNGLSERIPKEEIGAEFVVEEIRAIKSHFSPNAPVTLFGHSFGAMYSALYISSYPEDVAQAILAEPSGLNRATMEEAMRRSFKINLLDKEFVNRAWQLRAIGAQNHEELDFLGLNVMLNGNEVRYYCDSNNKPYWPIWRSGVYYDVIRNKKMMKGSKWNFDFAFGLKAYSKPVLIIGSSCSGIGADYQRTQIQPLFQQARVVEIADAGHRLVQEKVAEILAVSKEYLGAYP